MGQTLHKQESTLLVYALRFIVFILISMLSWTFISALFGIIGIL